jgi:hypothetical protein
MNDEMLEGMVRSELVRRALREVPQDLVARAHAIPSEHSSVSAVRVPAPRMLPARFAAVAAAALAIVGLAGVLAPRLTAPATTGMRPVPTLPPATQPSLPPAAYLASLIVAGAWISDEAAWLVDANSGLWLTTDGGRAWSGPRPLPHPIDVLRGGPTFLDGATGYAVWTAQDEDTVEVWVDRTEDGGVTWTSVKAGALESSSDEMNSATVHFSDEGHGIVLAASYVAGEVPEGHAGSGLQPVTCSGWSTDDSGTTWTVLPDAPCSNHDTWASAQVGILMPASDGGAEVSVTMDGGRTWRTGTLPEVTARDAPFEVTFTVAANGSPRLAYWVFRADGGGPQAARIIVAESPDGGTTWTMAYEFAPPEGLDLALVSALGPDHWIGTGAGLPTTQGGPAVPVYETGDAGRSWSQTGTMGSIDGRTFGWSDRLHGMATGQDDSGCELPSGRPCHDDGWFLTNDGGRTWHGVPF